jgi:hypothetical protein
MSPCRNCDSPTPFLASECAPPPGTKGGWAHSPAGEGLEESLFRRLEKSFALCLLCGMMCSHVTVDCSLVAFGTSEGEVRCYSPAGTDSLGRQDGGVVGHLGRQDGGVVGHLGRQEGGAVGHLGRHDGGAVGHLGRHDGVVTCVTVTEDNTVISGESKGYNCVLCLLFDLYV